MSKLNFENFNLPKYLFVKMLGGLILGVVLGLTFKSQMNIFKPVLQIYYMLLQMVVYPFLVSALIYELGTCPRSILRTLFKKGIIFYLLIIILSIAIIWVAASVIPRASEFISLNPVQPTNLPNLINLFIPDNFVSALADNHLPAVIIFSIIFGLALRYQKKKNHFLEAMGTIADTTLRIWVFVLKLSPYFAIMIFAYLIGTVKPIDLPLIEIYLGLYLVAAAFMVLIFYPLFLKSFFDISFKQIMLDFLVFFVLTLVTGMSLAIIPLVIMRLRQIHHNKILANRSPSIVTLAYPFTQIGNQFLVLFIFFAAFYYNFHLNFYSPYTFNFLTFFSSMGPTSTSVNTLVLIDKLFNLPEVVKNLYLEFHVMTRFIDIMVSVCCLYTVSLLITASHLKKLRFNVKFLILLVLGLLIFYCGLNALQPKLQADIKAGRVNLTQLQLSEGLTGTVSAITYKVMPKNLEEYPATYDNIKKYHRLRVGYNPDMIPFSYFNDEGQLVGFDVALVYRLAKSLNVNLMFIPFKWSELEQDLLENKFDVAIGSVYVTADRLDKTAFSTSYLVTKPALLVRKNKEKQFSKADLSSINHLSVATLKDPILAPMLFKIFPKAKGTLLYKPQSFLSEHYDALLWTTYHVNALSSLMPDYMPLHLPQKDAEPILIAFMMNRQSVELKSYINNWFELIEYTDFLPMQKAKWLKGANH